ncbi:MAG: hypothetical protein Rhims3KO_01700 [Hyphomicrobiales bacterium]
MRRNRTTLRAVREVEINIIRPIAVSGMPSGSGSAKTMSPSTVNINPMTLITVLLIAEFFGVCSKLIHRLSLFVQVLQGARKARMTLPA